MLWASLIVFAFFLGSVPFGYFVGKTKGIDITQVGSGNIGATNVIRVLGKGPGILVLILDVLKGVVPSLVAKYYLGTTDAALICGLVAMVGHSFSPFLKFKGGKGVATGLGALIGSLPVLAGIIFVLFSALLFLTRFVSLSSIVTAISLPIIAWQLGTSNLALALITLLSAFLVFKHRSNIQRLLKGTESRFTWGPKKTLDVQETPEADRAL